MRVFVFVYLIIEEWERAAKPSEDRDYDTCQMAEDVIALADKLNWSKFHLVGFSMGGMISCKVASMVPFRVQSLSLIGVSSGGWEIIPRTTRAWRQIFRQLCCIHTPQDKQDIVLNFHFMDSTLEEWVPKYSKKRRELLLEEYMSHENEFPEDMQGQNERGVAGQMRACWYHYLSSKDISTIKRGAFYVKVIHGRHDLVASPSNAEKLARKLAASSVMLEGAHFIPRECADEVNLQLLKMIVYKNLYKSKLSRGGWLSPLDARVKSLKVEEQLQDLRVV
eukprot:TRINITY_DN18976_c0_g1_i1.p1 TRINITY_DN18976_c0_g1~~TRINITY_DN18976_c0_g1_i1.p1  ORF type:complete len:279 (-),score=38.02 TRINITY_DN18976_c0_g1_i1:27-863(-)